MGFKDDVEEELEKLVLKNQANFGLLPSGINPVCNSYSEYDGLDETNCEHKNVREIKLLTSIVRECIDCGEELK
jgi:hypothetical protein